MEAKMSFKTVAEGVLVREHPTRMYKGKPDRYFTIRFRVNGKRFHVALGWSGEGWNVEKAKRTLAELKVAATTGAGPATLKERRSLAEAEKKADQSAPTLGSVWDAYKRTLEGRSSHSAFSSIARLHLQNILPVKIEDLRTAHLDALRSELENKDLSPQTIKHALSLIRQTIRWGAVHGYCIMPPLHQLHFEMPSFDNTKTEFLDQSQIKTLLDALDNYEDQKIANAMRLALHTGMRRTAIFSLRWSDLDFNFRQICLRADASKNGKVSFIPMTPSVQAILRATPRTEGANEELVFGQRNSYNSAIKKLSEYAKQYLPEGYRPWHSLRHTFASQIASSGKADLLTLQKLLTHRDASATQRYAHMADQALARLASVMDGIIHEAVNSEA